ncbi:MAG: RHS repeat-associated core domain-containing protein, partial [Prochloron sp. SP5CPC1]|nr:RHS repeat-associated core domain-containing protein [Candidatus Paraprochloron terpiosi SP5CPC1]
TDLESPYLVTNGSGEVVSRYVYAGDTPLLRLDENGEAVYYLTDALGSVIGLANGSGGSATRFHYDSFGNLRGATGTKTAVSPAAGGDFRFQGQWLEANTDLYHFRARYYDPETGRFVTRDPVDIVEREPESSNLYQFAYHNPRVYTDPSGAITLNELQIRNTVQNILSTIRQNIISGLRDEVKDRALGVAGDILNNFISKMLPVDFNLHNDRIDKYTSNPKKDPGIILEELVRDTVCDLLSGAGVPTDAFNSVWITPRITVGGVPQTNGVNCNREYQSPGVRIDKNLPNPDFLISGHPPLETNNGKKSWLIGDFKLNPKGAIDYVNKNHKQWQAMSAYAEEREYIPLAMYINFYQPKSPVYVEEAKGKALREGVLLYFVSLTAITK